MFCKVTAKVTLKSLYQALKSVLRSERPIAKQCTKVILKDTFPKKLDALGALLQFSAHGVLQVPTAWLRALC